MSDSPPHADGTADGARTPPPYRLDIARRCPPGRGEALAEALRLRDRLHRPGTDGVGPIAEARAMADGLIGLIDRMGREGAEYLAAPPASVPRCLGGVKLGEGFGVANLPDSGDET